MSRVLLRWPGVPWALLLLAVVAAGYGEAAVRADYVHDDFAAVVGHPAVRWPLDLPALARARYFGGSDYAYVFALRPLATASFAAEIGLGLATPLGRHAVQLLLLLAVSALAGMALWRWGRLRGWPAPQTHAAAGLAAALFAVHPVHTEAVMAVAYRPELLAALFLLVGTHHLLSLCAGARRPGLQLLGLGAAALAALGSKESAAAGLVWWGLWALADRRAWQRLRLSWAVLAAALALWLSWRVWAVGALLDVRVPRHDNPLAHVGTAERLWGGLDLTGRAALQLLAPHHLAPDYTFDAWPTPHGLTALGGLGLAALLAALAWVALGWARHAGIAAAGAARTAGDAAESADGVAIAPLPHGGWLLVLGLLGAWLPVSQLLTAGTVLYADRLLTLPSLLLALALAVGLARLAALPRAALAAALLLAMVAQTRAVAADWTSSLAVYQRGVRLEPRALRMRLNLAHALTAQGQPRAALVHANAALALDPADPKGWVIGLDAALAAGDCAAAEPFAAAAAASDRKAVTARLAALGWGMRCGQFARAWAIARRLPTARLSGQQALDLYALAHAAGDAQGAMALAQRLGVDVARQPAWVSAAVFGHRSAGRPLEALALLADLQRRQPAPEIVRHATEIIAGLTSAEQRAAAARLWPPPPAPPPAPP